MANQDYCIASYCSSVAWGGLELNVLRFLSWLSERGRPVHLYGNPASRLLAEAPAWGIPVSPIASTVRYGDVLNGWRLARALRRDGVQRLVVHQSRDMFMGVVASKCADSNLRLIYSQHMHIGGTKKDAYHAWVHRQFDAWVVPVQWLADRVLEKTVIPKERLHVVPRGIDMARFIDHQPDRLKARDRYGLPHRAIVVGLVGRLDPKKCQDVVISAVAALATAYPDLHLLLIGEQSQGEGDQYVAHIHQLVATLGLVDRVHFRPFEEHVEWTYAPMDIFVLASKSEAYGMVTIEAMASGVPVIGTNDGGTVSLIDHGRNGLLVTPKNVEELTDALRRLLSDRDFARQLAQTARQEAPTRFSHTAQCDAWERLLGSL